MQTAGDVANVGTEFKIRMHRIRHVVHIEVSKIKEYANNVRYIQLARVRRDIAVCERNMSLARRCGGTEGRTVGAWVPPMSGVGGSKHRQTLKKSSSSSSSHMVRMMSSGGGRGDDDAAEAAKLDAGGVRELAKHKRKEEKLVGVLGLLALRLVTCERRAILNALTQNRQGAVTLGDLGDTGTIGGLGRRCLDAWRGVVGDRVSRRRWWSLRREVRIQRIVFKKWREWSEEKARARETEEVASLHYDIKLAHGALHQWRLSVQVGRVSRFRRQMATHWSDQMIIFNFFGTWRNVARRRKLLRERLALFARGNVASYGQLPNAVDIWLSQLPASMYMMKLRNALQGMKSSVHVRLENVKQAEPVRWSRFDQCQQKYDPSRYTDGQIMVGDDTYIDITVQKLKVEETIAARKALREELHQELEEVMKSVKTVKRNHASSIKKLEEYTSALEEIENTKNVLQERMDSLMLVLSDHEGKFTEACAMLRQVEGVHESISETSESVATSLSLLYEEIKHSHEELKIWKARKDNVGSRSTAKHPDCTDMVRLKEAQEMYSSTAAKLERLYQEEERFLNADKEAKSAKYSVSFELERVSLLHGSRKRDLDEAHARREMLEEKILRLESQAHILSPRIVELSQSIGITNEKADKFVQRINILKQRIAALDDTLRRHHKEAERLEKARLVASEGKSQIMRPRVSVRRQTNMSNCIPSLEACNTPGSQESVDAVAALSDDEHCSIPIGFKVPLYNSDQFMGNLASVCSEYRLLQKVIHCWKDVCNKTCLARGQSDVSYKAHNLPWAFDAWRESALSARLLDQVTVDEFKRRHILRGWNRHVNWKLQSLKSVEDSLSRSNRYGMSKKLAVL